MFEGVITQFTHKFDSVTASLAKPRPQMVAQEAWISGSYEGGRHAKRVAKITAIEEVARKAKA